MRGARRIAAVGLLAVLSGCASSGASRTGAGRLDAGALALRRGEFGRAAEALAEARRTCGEARLGRQALLLIAALEMDPRNPSGDPDRAAALAGHWLTRPETFPWTRPIAETLYLQALRAGGGPYAEPAAAPAGVRELLEMVRPADGAGETCDALEWEVLAAGGLPDLDRRRPRGSAGGAGRLHDDNARLRERVARLEAELERIRETLRP